ncbi:glycoside hydrolase family 5 protein [Jidongwangia harbinensis]|uniref:glycoside hydrolase family 5 protein n=1 Tax=Jidongwangia harbinensis TaxID=2878561 RepID=UPI001CD9E078|nr:glycoside hydrolase family 5 protein [Jidongwangia harbinensis]MCA2218317.1 glycoside hydrolase family 5 protein [Jidongwangia harbinensis]
MTSDDANALLKVDGTRLVRPDGTEVVLRGVGLGGWMNMENFITGYPATESQMRRALRRVLGEEGYQRFFDRFYTAFFGPDDAALLASLGLNSVRIPFNYHHFEDDERPFELKEEGFARLDAAVRACSDHGLYSILDLHAVPGAQNQHWHSDNPTHWAHFWTHPHFQDRAVHLWEALADRYKDNPWVAGYNPLNEPGDVSGTGIAPFYERVERAIRAVDPHHVLYFDGNRYGTDFSAFDEPLPNCVYTTHDYALPGFVDGGPYPGESRGQYVDSDRLEQTFLQRTEYMRRTGTPIWIGEFGPVYTGDPDRDAQRYQVLRDQLDIYREHGASWSLWTYKDIGLQGLVSAAPDSPYLRRIEAFLAKKARLGADSWGSVDTGIRHLMEPVEKLFAEEFPDFEPYPWNKQRWIQGLLRHVMLAEPLVDDFAACFRGVTPEQAEELADSFRVDRCVRREPLLEILGATG